MEMTFGEVKPRITTGGSFLYTRAAQRLAARATALDDLNGWRARDAVEREDLENELLEVSLATVITSYSAVEAAVNELYLERAEFDRSVWFKGLSDELAMRLKSAWSEGVRKLNPIEKSKIALSIAQVKDFDWGAGAAQSLGLLHDLRNALVHHTPMTIVPGPSPSESQDALERSLYTRFPTALIWGERNVTFRWAGCLGSGCAQWAATTAAGFQKEFFGALECAYPSEGTLSQILDVRY